jgi:type I restriction enzyme M protein
MTTYPTCWPNVRGVTAVADSKARPDELTQLRQLLDRFEPAADLVKVRFAVLALAFLRAHDYTSWAAARSSETAFDELLGKLPHEISDEVRDVLPDLRPVMPALMDALEPVVGRAGITGAFQQLLEEFAPLGGRRDGTGYTPRSVAAVMAGLIDINSATTVFDPFCRSGELLAAATTDADARPQGFSVYGATPGSESLAMARMNLILRDVPSEFGVHHTGESAAPFRERRKFSRVLTNPPFNQKHWAAHDEHNWRYGPPPEGNANFAWLQYVVERLEPDGHAAVIMPNGASSSSSPREQHIRKGLVEDGCVEALISLPPALFHNTGIPVTIWALTPPGTERHEILFADASEAGHLIDRTRRALSDTETSEIIDTLTTWRSGRAGNSSNVRAVSVPLPEIRERGYNLNPHIYLSEPAKVSSSKAVLSTVRQLLRQLETQETEAAAADAAAMGVLRGLTR